LTLEEMLRLELHRVVSIRVCAASGGGEKRRIDDMGPFFQNEVDRLEELMNRSGKENAKKVRPIM
jgi:hypothetical protein